jgi:glycosyltransferase involved in cell wall biosynthesis
MRFNIGELRTPKIYIYTNIPAPYNHHFWQHVCKEFPGSAIIFTEPMHKDRVWVDDASKHNYRYYYFIQNFYIPKLDRISTGLIPWLISNAREAFHLLWSCGRGNNYFIRYFGKLLGDKLVHCNDGAFADTLTEVAIQRYRERFLPAVSAVYTAGRIGKEYFKKLGYRDDQIFNSYFSHDVDYFTSERIHNAEDYRKNIREELGIQDSHFVILTVSRLLDLKRLEDLHEALQLLEHKQVANFHVVLIGDGEHQVPVTAMQRDLQSIRFHWIKGIAYEDMPKYYAMSDLLVHPSEGDIWGLVVNEALSMGRPVICTERIGAAELVRDGENGFVVSVRAPAEIADRIERLYNDKLLLKRMSERACDITERWNSKLAIKSLKSLIHYVQTSQR